MATVLAVDDDQVMREYCSKLFAKVGHSVLGPAENGPGAIALCQSQVPDFILMDIVMPGSPNGIGATAQILEFCPATKILTCTGFSALDAVEWSIRAGAKGFLAKPFHSRTLIEVMNRLLDGGTFFPSLNTTETNRETTSALSFPVELLSPLELRILFLLGHGRDDREISIELGLTEPVVGGNCQTIKAKLGGTRAPDLAEMGRVLVKRGCS